MSDSHWLLRAVVGHIALRARGAALPIVKGLVEQIPQFLAMGMPVEMALRESLLLAIHSAQLQVRHCVGSERHALDDFIETCAQMESKTGQLMTV